MIFTVFVEEVPPEAANLQSVVMCWNVDLSHVVIAGILSDLNCLWSAGFDYLHSYMMKAYSNALALLLYHLFVRSLREGVLPTSWMTSIRTFLLKNRNECNPLNSRPVKLGRCAAIYFSSLFCRSLWNI